MQGGETSQGKNVVTLRHQPSGRTIGYSQEEFDALNEFLSKNQQAIMNGPSILQTAYQKWQSTLPAVAGT